MAALAALVPAALALLFAAWCGAFGAGAGWGAAASGWVLLVASAAWVGRDWRDPWRLGPAGSLLPWALLAAAVLSWRVSPVLRAGTVGVALLPAFLWLPAALARAWRTEAGRRRGARAVAVAVAAVAGAALAFWLSGETPRPALPVGQHLHLTAWLALLLPLALVPWRERGPWRGVAVVAGGLGAAAVLGGRTVTGGLALAIEAGLGLAWCVASRRSSAPAPALARRAGVLAAVVAVATLALLWPDLAAIVRGADPSFAARGVYWRAGWAGLLERPVLGFGPGSTAWTLAAFLLPVPGVNPPSEVVGELHMLPLGVAYELGLPGLLLAAGATGLFAWRRLRERAAACDPGLLAAGLVGLGGGAVAGLGTADWRVAALPLAAAAAAGAALAGGARSGAGGAAEAPGSRPAGAFVTGAYVLAAAVLLTPIALAQRAYDRAARAPREAAVRWLDRAVELDPGFPLYRARRGWLEAEREDGRGRADSLRAARDALGVAPLWLAAGAAAEGAGERAAGAFAYERSCALDPLGALAPFRLLQVGSPIHQPLAVASRAVAADPRLAAAAWWRGREELRHRAVLHLATSAGIDEGWRAALVAAAGALPPPAASADGSGTASAELALVFDASTADSVSLHLFRRRPWAARLAPVTVDAAAARAVEGLPPAVALTGTDRRLFPPTCTGAFVPQGLRKTLWKSR
jgi:O-antigen ligase